MSNLINFSGRPFFSTTDTAGATAVTGDGTIFTPIFTNTTGSGYNTSTGIYTAPMAGWYFFLAIIEFSNLNSAMNSGQYTLVTTAKTYYIANFNPGAVRGPAGAALSGNCILTHMSAGNTAFINTQISGSAKIANWSGTASIFSGVRLF